MIIWSKHTLITMFTSRSIIDVKTKNIKIGDENSDTHNFINQLIIYRSNNVKK